MSARRRSSWSLALIAAVSPAVARAAAPVVVTDAAFAADVQRGRKLTDDAARQLESAVALHPDDAAARARLIGYYADRTAAFPQRRLPHVLWLIRHRPADPATPACAAVSPLSDAPGYAKASAAWDEQIAAHPKDPAVLANAAAFLDNDQASAADVDKAQDLLRRATEAAPKASEWPARLARSLERQADRTPARAVELFTQAEQLRQQAYDRATNRTDRFHVLIGEPADVFGTGDLIAAKRSAAQLLAAADDFPADPAHGEAVHRANVVLGQVALGTGNAERAATYLAAAAKADPSPALAAAGPDLSLARDLLARGDRSAVREYLSACAPLWPGGRERLKGWVATLDAGGTPVLK